MCRAARPTKMTAMPIHASPVTFAERVSAATPPDRDRFIDAVKAGSLLV
ncbi:MAG: hypothetical protein QOF35_702, partial [Actinomycetota bacterium]|nr:hypothetical protein [Actinomycetota bacterium]